MSPRQFRPSTPTQLLAALGLSAMMMASNQPARADTDYQSIAALNPFRLKPVMPPNPGPWAPVVPSLSRPLVMVELTGIADVLSVRKACLEIIPGPGKAMLKPVLSEGERLDSIEVISIDMARNEVVIRNGPVTTNLTFKVAKASTAFAVPVPVLPAVTAHVRPAARSRQVIVTGGANPSSATEGSRGATSGELTPARPGGSALSPAAAVIDLEKKRNDHPSLPYPPTLISPRAPVRPGAGRR